MAKLILRKPAPQSRRTNARESSHSKPSVLRSAGVSMKMAKEERCRRFMLQGPGCGS